MKLDRATQLAQITREAVEQTEPERVAARAKGAFIVVTSDVPDLLMVPGNAGELREMLVQVILSAIHAMPKGGSLSIRARALSRQVLIEVADTGEAKTSQVGDKIAEMVKRHHGSLDIRTDFGAGTLVVIRLPREESVTPPAAGVIKEKVAPLRILFADDDAALRKIVPMSLQRSGHTVTVAADGSEALALFEPGKFDLILTDLSMPNLTGEKLARAIKDQSATQPVIILTGYGDTLLKKGPKPEYVDLLINKPITPDELSKAIARVVPQPDVVAASA